jgi:cold shock protein
VSQGIIKKLADKGYGFITPEGGGADVFFHASSLDNVAFDELQEGDTLEYEPGEGKNGKSAAFNVSRIHEIGPSS